MSVQVTKNRNNFDSSIECIISVLKNINIETKKTDFIINNKSNNTPLLLLLDSSNKNKFLIPTPFLLGIVKYSMDICIFEIELEEFCPYGLYCPYKINPLKCPFNHHEMPKKLIKGNRVPTLICRYELYKRNGEKMICNNPYCWYNHAKGRALRIFNGYYYHY